MAKIRKIMCVSSHSFVEEGKDCYYNNRSPIAFHECSGLSFSNNYWNRWVVEIDTETGHMEIIEKHHNT